eukprot:gene5777-7975_t
METTITSSLLRNALEESKAEGYISDQLVMEKCAVLCNKYPQTPTEFITNLDSFLMNNDSPSLSLELIGKFEQSLIKNYQKTKQIKENSSTPHSIIGIHNVLPSPEVSSLGKRTNNSFQTPNGVKQVKLNTFENDVITPDQINLSQSDSSVKIGVSGNYLKRTNAGQTVTSFNTSLSQRGNFEPSLQGPLGIRCKVNSFESDFENISERYRFMYTSLDERSRALEKHMLKVQADMCKMANIDETSLQPIGVPSQDLVWVCGRICCDGEGKINKSSVLLEGSRRDSGGRRSHLDLSEISSYSLFPGQIVLVEGINSSGRKMTARKIIEGQPCPNAMSSPSSLIDFHHSKKYQDSQPLQVITASGPFTTSDNLDYLPLQDLLYQVLQKKPDVLILTGPFVDITQPLLSTGEVKLINGDNDGEDTPEEHMASYEMVFVERVIRDCLQSMFSSEVDLGKLPTQIILVPSLLDAHHEFVFPQPPFGDRDRINTNFFEEDLGILSIPYTNPEDKMRRIHLMPNPCMFRVNEVLFSVCSNDILFSISSDEVSSNIEGNRLARLATHVMQQQSFCAQFPVPSNIPSQYDLRHARHCEFKLTPDVLVIPSKLTPLVKELTNGSLVINPGQLTKGTTGGTFAELSIHPIKETELRDLLLQGKESISHSISSRATVNIVRI